MSRQDNDDFSEEEKRSSPHWGEVRASPYGACLTQRNAESWHGWRKTSLTPLEFPREGYGHLYGQEVIDQVDRTPLGTAAFDKLGDPVKAAAFDGRDYGSTKTPGE